MAEAYSIAKSASSDNPDYTWIEGFLKPEEWMKDAACQQVDPDIFFPDQGSSTREARAVCASCDVQAACAEYAMRNGERWGFWGGMTEGQLRRRRRLEKGAA